MDRSFRAFVDAQKKQCYEIVMKSSFSKSLFILLSVILLTACVSAQKMNQPTLHPLSQSTKEDSFQKNIPPPKPLAYFHFLRSQLKLNEGKIDEAIGELREAIASDGKEPTLHVELASLYIYKGLLNEAIEEGNEALRYAPKHLIAHPRLG